MTLPAVTVDGGGHLTGLPTGPVGVHCAGPAAQRCGEKHNEMAMAVVRSANTLVQTLNGVCYITASAYNAHN